MCPSRLSSFQARVEYSAALVGYGIASFALGLSSSGALCFVLIEAPVGLGIVICGTIHAYLTLRWPRGARDRDLPRGRGGGCLGLLMDVQNQANHFEVQNGHFDATGPPAPTGPRRGASSSPRSCTA